MRMTANAKLNCNVLIVTTYIPRRYGNLPRYNQINVTSGRDGQIVVTRYASSPQESEKIKELEMIYKEEYENKE